MQEDRDHRKLNRRIVATTLSFSFIPLFALGVSLYLLFSDSYTIRVMDGIRTIAENRRNTIDLFLDERISQLYTLAYTHSLDRLKDEEYLKNVLGLMQARARAFIDLGVIDETGNHAAYVGPYSLHGLNYADEEWFRQTMLRGVYVSDVFLGFRKAPHFIIAVKRIEGDQCWILRATVDADIFDAMVETARIGTGGDCFVVNREGVLQTRALSGGNLLGKVDYLNLSSFSGIRVEQITVNKERALFAFTWLKGKDWMLVVREDPREEFIPILRARHLVLGLGTGGLLLIILGAILVSRHMIQQLIQADREKADLNASLVQSTKLAALGELAASIAHEVNNPLAIIKEKVGWIRDLLGEDDVSRCENLDELTESSASIESNVDRARRMTERLLNFSRRSQPSRERVNVNHLVEQTIEFVKKEAQHRSISIHTELLQDLPETLSDSTQVQQVFLNILNNAVDAIGKGGEIDIKTSFSATEREIAVSIADNGPGIPNEMMNRIFQPFFTTKEVGKGTGLGLSISYTIIQKLGGRIMVASEVGKGTTFAVYLPVAREDSSPT
jgi:two-component system, NtrC family, sensor kinase